jgi:two-component system response regulator RegX3
MDQQRILVIESETVGRLKMELQLLMAGYAVTFVHRCADAIDLLERERFDLLITDLCLTTGEGMQTIIEAREIDPDMLVISLIPGAIAAPRIAAISQYVYRYLVKPVASDDLLRGVVDALVRRRRLAERPSIYQSAGCEAAEPRIIRVGPLRIDSYRHRVTHSGQALSLTCGEYSLLMYLTRRRGIVVTPLEIVRDVLHYSCSLLEARDLSKSHIHRLRRKIEPSPGAPRLILCVRGAGYRLADEDELEEGGGEVPR